MNRRWCLSIAMAAVIGLAIVPVAEAQTLTLFDGGIGVIPTGSANTSVRGVPAAGQIWVIRDLRAEVQLDGGIRVDGRGLLLGAGNNIGSNGNANVFATLICEAQAPFVQRNTSLEGVPLGANGDFVIEDMLSPPAPVGECASPVLLIRNAANGGWFAAGIPRR